MKLKAKHIYRVDIVNSRDTKNYCLIAPKNDFDTDNPPVSYGCSIDCTVCIDIRDDFHTNTPIYFTFKGNCIFEHASVSDIIEMTRRLKKEVENFRYDFKSGEIKKYFNYEGNR